MILAHNYERPEVQDVADYVGDSLGLSRRAAAYRRRGDRLLRRALHGRDGQDPRRRTRRSCCPTSRAGCSLADTITPEELRDWKPSIPTAVVVSYVNTTAAVKAETDYCCTSGNAVEVINAIPADQEILFLPDMFLGAHVRRITGRDRTSTSGWGSATCTPGSPRSRSAAARGAPGRRGAGASRVRLLHERPRGDVGRGDLRPRGSRSSRPRG